MTARENVVFGIGVERCVTEEFRGVVVWRHLVDVVGTVSATKDLSLPLVDVMKLGRV